MFRLETQSEVFVFYATHLHFFGKNTVVKYGQELHPSRFFLLQLLFLLITKLTPVALIEIMFLFNKQI
jgi:hypothetical protein